VIYGYICIENDENIQKMAINTGLEEIIRNHRNLTYKVFKKGEVIFSEGEPPAGLYFIESGSVKIFKREPDNTERIMHLASKGDILGLHSVVNNHDYSNSAVAISVSKVCFIAADEFLQIVESSNTYKLLVMKSLCSRIDSLEDHIVRVNDKKTDERFADTLLILLEKYGMNSSKDLKINLTLDELASFTCTSRSYMKKIISDFSRRGLITLAEGKINILNINRIRDLAALSRQVKVN
jgi:CRP-like cAMP-binding protein